IKELCQENYIWTAVKEYSLSDDPTKDIEEKRLKSYILLTPEQKDQLMLIDEEDQEENQEKNKDQEEFHQDQEEFHQDQEEFCQDQEEFQQDQEEFRQDQEEFRQDQEEF